jgi:hypothetical protein
VLLKAPSDSVYGRLEQILPGCNYVDWRELGDGAGTALLGFLAAVGEILLVDHDPVGKADHLGVVELHGGCSSRSSSSRSPAFSNFEEKLRTIA